MKDEGININSYVMFPNRWKCILIINYYYRRVEDVGRQLSLWARTSLCARHTPLSQQSEASLPLRPRIGSGECACRPVCLQQCFFFGQGSRRRYFETVIIFQTVIVVCQQIFPLFKILSVCMFVVSCMSVNLSPFQSLVCLDVHTNMQAKRAEARRAKH